MNNTDLDIVMQTYILSMQGQTDYSLIYLNPPNPLLSNIGIKTADFCKFLIQLYENESKLKSHESTP